MEPTATEKKFLTVPAEFRDVSRGDPKPYTLKGDALVKARLTPDSWRLEIVSDGSTTVEKPRKLGRVARPSEHLSASHPAAAKK
jgi:hypothetical protein